VLGGDPGSYLKKCQFEGATKTRGAGLEKSGIMFRGKGEATRNWRNSRGASNSLDLRDVNGLQRQRVSVISG